MTELQPLPDTDLARAARTYLSEIAVEPLINHSLRSYLFAAHVARAQGLQPGVDFDDELVFLSCALHDIGLTAEGNGEQRFEVDGADLAVRFLRDRGLSADRAEVVWDAIALHTSPGIADRKAPEVALSFYGISMDIFGFGAEQLPREVHELVHAGRPRLDLAREMAEIIVAQSVGKPGKTPPFSFPAAVVDQHVPDAGMPTYEQLVRSGPWGS